MMIKPKRLQRQRTRGWRKDMVSTNPNGSVIVDRSSQWGNPVICTITVTDVAGKEVKPIDRHWKEEQQRAVATALFRTYAEERLKNDPTWLEPLRGKDLFCTCPLLKENGELMPCHANVLLKLANP